MGLFQAENCLPLPQDSGNTAQHEKQVVFALKTNCGRKKIVMKRKSR
jgi:hypothetical protein